MALDQDKLKALPKVELHVHLEGCVDASFWHQLLTRHGQEAPSLEELEGRFRFQNFDDFLGTFVSVIKSFKSPEDFSLLTERSLNHLADQGVVYTEMLFTPYYFEESGLNHQEVMQEIDRAAKAVEAARGIEMKMIFDGPRNLGNQVVSKVFDLAAADKTGRVIAVGLGGDEKNFPAYNFINEFAQARANGLLAVCHAGENDGEQSMLDAIELLGASRISHALGILPGSRIEEVIQTQGIALELCPTSNVKTGRIKELKYHPFKHYFESGYQITLNSDDPGFFGSDLLNEFQVIAKEFDFGPAEACQLSKRAVDSSFLPGARKAELTQQILDHFEAWID